MRAPIRLLGTPLVLLAALALSGCGGGGSNASGDASLTPLASTPATVPGGVGDGGSGTPSQAAPTAASGRSCGKLQMKGNAQPVVIVKGAVTCKTVLPILTAYVKAPKAAGGAATVKTWKCRTATAAQTKKSGYVTVCTKGADEFVTKKH